jgi:hypothetical protein
MASECRHIRVTEQGGQLVVRFSTILVRYSLYQDATVDEIRQELDSLLAHDPARPLILDFQGSDFFFRWDFVAMLVRLNKNARHANGMLYLCDLPPAAIHRLRTAKLIRILAVSQSLDDAVAGKVLDPN